MSYTKQNFKAGDTLKAAQLNTIEDGIIANEAAIETKQPKGDYATKDDVSAAVNGIKIPTVPTKVSQLTNDAGYAKKTELPSTEGLATEDFVITKLGEVTGTTVKKRNFVSIGTPQVYIAKDEELEGDALQVFENVSAVYAAFDELAAAHPHMFKKQASLGKDASGTYDINYYTLGQTNPKIAIDRTGTQPMEWNDAVYPRRRIYINGNIHSWVERHCCFGLYLFVKEVLESNEQWALFIKNNLIIDIVPQPNPWGYDNKTNVNVNKKNLNRTYLTDKQAENICITNLIESLIPKGLIGIIDLHNTNDGTPGYTIGKTSHKYWGYLCTIAAQIEAISHNSYAKLCGADKDSFYHIWNYDSAGISGLLNDYADTKNLICYTSEVGNNASSGPLFKRGSVMTKLHLVNVINAIYSLTDAFIDSSTEVTTTVDITGLFTFTDGAAIETYTGNGKQGTTYATPLFKYSDYVDVSEMREFDMSFVTWRSGGGKQATLGYALYDVDKNFVSGRAFDLADASLGNSAGAPYTEHVVITDPTVKYIRTCYPTDTTKYGEFQASVERTVLA